MIAEQISTEYFTWVKENHRFYNLKPTTSEIQTPFLDSYGDNISFSIIAENNGNKFKLTDLGYTIWNLEANGINVTNKKNLRTQLLQSVLQFEGAKIEGDKEIVKETTKNHLGQAIHDMTQLLIRLSDLSLVHKRNVRNLFEQDVEEYFAVHREQYRFFPSLSVQGKSNLLHKFNYLFFSSDNSQKLVRVQNSIAKNSVDSILTSWLDTSQLRQEQYGEHNKLEIIVNGQNYHSINEEYIVAFDEYNIGLINFDDKDQLLEKLA